MSEQIIANPINSGWQQTHNGRQDRNHGTVNFRPGYEHVPFSVPSMELGNLSKWQGNGAQAEGVGIGHAVGWKLAAEVMGIDWMKRDELTQAIPPVYMEWIGRQLMAMLEETR